MTNNVLWLGLGPISLKECFRDIFVMLEKHDMANSDTLGC